MAIFPSREIDIFKGKIEYRLSAVLSAVASAKAEALAKEEAYSIENRALSIGYFSIKNADTSKQKSKFPK